MGDRVDDPGWALRRGVGALALRLGLAGVGLGIAVRGHCAEREVGP